MAPTPSKENAMQAVKMYTTAVCPYCQRAKQLLKARGVESIEEIPLDLKRKYATAFCIDWSYLVDAAARRQKWIDQSQSVNLFFGDTDIRPLSHMYRAAWRKGLKTTYYLRTLSASNIEKATVDLEKEKRGIIAQSPAASEADLPAKKQYTEAEVKACSLEARMRGEECEACQ